VIRGGEPVWFGGGKLAADLSLPKIRSRWGGGGADGSFTTAERSAVWEHVARAADQALGQVRDASGGDPGAAADAAWATADTLHAAASALGSRVLREAADAYDRAARVPYGRIPPRSAAGDGLRRAARLLAAYGYLTSDPSFRPLVLITRLMVLAEAVAGLRQAQGRAAQAAGALGSAERLRAAGEFYDGAGTGERRTAASLASAGFPGRADPGPAGAGTPVPQRAGPTPTAPRPGHHH
jgi:hypothetical protein